MNNKPTFSIIIPLYNSEKYIEETLQSLSEQTEKDFEIIIINDGSTDKSVEVAKNFLSKNKELNARFFVEKPKEFPKGVSGSRNFGIFNSDGTWICFLDSDDLFHPEKISILKNQIEKLSPAVMAIHHPHMEFNDGHPITFDKPDKNPSIEVSNILDRMVRKNLVATSTVCIRKSILEKTGYFDTELAGVEDYYLWLHVSKYSDWCYLPFRLTAYRVRLDSLMGGRKMRYYINQNHLLVKKIHKNNLFQSPHKQAVMYYFMRDVMQYYGSISLTKHGWSDFLSGIFSLIRKGYIKFAFEILGIQIKFLVLKLISKPVHRIKKKITQ